jgi:hypothetical protein
MAFALTSEESAPFAFDEVIIMTQQDDTMAELLEPGHADQASMTELVAGILGDAQTLIKQQFAMLRAEVTQEANRAAQAGRYLGLGALLIVVGSVFVSVGLVYLLSWLAPDMPIWACWFLVGGLLAGIGVVVFLAGRNRFSALTPRPEKSLNALQENLSWIANRQS